MTNFFDRYDPRVKNQGLKLNKRIRNTENKDEIDSLGNSINQVTASLTDLYQNMNEKIKIY